MRRNSKRLGAYPWRSTAHLETFSRLASVGNLPLDLHAYSDNYAAFALESQGLGRFLSATFSRNAYQNAGANQ
jgi:hypothetical protein